MKKLLAFLIVFAMVFTLCACGGTATAPATGDSSTGAAAGTSAPAEGKGLVGFATVSMSESIYVLEEAALKAIFEGKADVQTVSCDQDAATQIQQIKTFATMGADLIVINPTDIEALSDAIMEAHNSGCKIYINGATSDALGEEYYECCTVSDEYLCGAYVAMAAKNWIEAHEAQLNAANPNWELAFLESSLSEETLARTYGEESLVEEYLKNSAGEYVDAGGNVVDEANKVANPAYCAIAAKHFAGVKVEQDQANGGLNVANVLTTNPNTLVFVAYNSLASTQGGQYIVDNYPDELDNFAFFSAGVMGNEADYIVSSVSDLNSGINAPSIMRGACQFGVSAQGGEVADSVARTAYAIMYGEEGVDYTKKNPDGIAAWWAVDETWGGGTAYVAHFNILEGATVQAFDPIGALKDENTVIFWNSKDGYVVEAPDEAELAAAAENAPQSGVPAAAAPIAAGEYEYMETTPFGEIRWTLTLNEDGTAVVAQPENESMGNPTWTASWKDNGDGTCTTSECKGEGPQIADFWEDNSIQWTILNEGKCVPSKSSDYANAVATFGLPAAGGTAAEAVPAGEYTFMEATPFGEIMWTVSLNDDGTAIVAQPDNESMGNPTWTASWKDNGDGTFDTYDCAGEGPQIAAFWHDNAITWIYNGDGTVTAK